MLSLKEISDSKLQEIVQVPIDLSDVRKLLKLCQNDDGKIDTNDFADEFARSLESSIVADEDSWEWEESWFDNAEWGLKIAKSVNEFLISSQD